MADTSPTPTLAQSQTPSIALWSARLLTIASITFTISLLAYLTFFTWSIHIPFDTDEADHANAALDLFMQTRNNGLAGFIDSILRQTFYPPLHSLFVSLSYLILTPSYFSSRLPSIIFLLGSTLLLPLTISSSFRTHPNKLIVSSITALILTTSPLILQNSILSMLELDGIFFFILALFLLSRSQPKDPVSTKTFTLLFIFSTILFFVKYNYGLVFIGGVGFFYASYLLSAPLKSIIRGTQFLSLFALIFTAWIYSTNKESVLDFFIGHPSYAPLFSSENIFFDLHSYFADYFFNSITPWLLLIPIALNLKELTRNIPTRFALCFIAATLFILFLSTTNEVRHAIFIIPAVLYLFGVSTLTLLSRHPRYTTPVTVIFSLWALLIITSTLNARSELRKSLVKEMEGHPTFALAQEWVAERAPCSGKNLVVGTGDSFSIESFRWNLAKHCSLPYTEITLDSFPYRPERLDNIRLRRRNVWRFSGDLMEKNYTDIFITSGGGKVDRLPDTSGMTEVEKTTFGKIRIAHYRRTFSLTRPPS